MPRTPDRLAYINGLRDLADFLDTNPDIPTPEGTLTAYYFPRGTDEEIRARVDHVARLLSAVADEPAQGHYSAGINFGMAEYKAVGLLASSRARWAAIKTIVLDPDPTDPAPDA
ncbi:hypothetical protein Sme01_36310 [Sphaerisporangium melleum]|uniref:Uncharacterized protein n=1 Tax=Sphaerisporangium melleum TaxID=321316 RepID=A0A917RR22_9ACTN|nr:hypothetical protein [Sphaerisporangium melleum]GGL19190.1 hypothetical protein GCM10007964_71490 [Sphaerisporangium melleum]GII71155.1 hypothetical protein Sme01_36310 [Sphaerisporangium melleum]